MTTRAVLATALLLAALALAVPALADVQPEAAEEEPAAGEELSAFVQTTEAGAAGDVDDGVFEARFERADEDERADLLEQRSRSLEERTDRVEGDLDELEAAGEGNLTPAERARAASVAARLRSLDRSLNVTEERADAAGVDADEVDRLRTRTRELSGREVAQRARDVAGGGGPPGWTPASDGDGGPPDGVGGGPPNDARERGNAGGAGGNDRAEHDRDGRGDGTDDGAGGSNRSPAADDRGRSDDPGRSGETPA